MFFHDIGSWGVLTPVIVIIGDLLIIVAIAHMLSNKRSPTSTTAWLLAIIVIPHVSVPMYLIFGGRKASRAAMLKDDIKIVRDENVELTDPEDSRIDRMLRSQGMLGATVRNRVELLGTPLEGYEGLCRVIESAQESLFIETFIFGNDEVARDILDRIVQRAKSGVTVRLLVDGVGTIKTGRRFFQPLVDAGGHFAFFSPLIRIPLKFRSNLRNHRKIAIADQRLCMAGGMNIYNEEISPEPREDSWADLSYLIEGPEVIGYTEIFRSDWNFSDGEPFELEHRVPVPEPGMDAAGQLIPSGPDVDGDALYEAIMMSAFDARERLWIVTPYFVPDEALSQAIRIACHRGVDVRLIVPSRSNHVLTDIAGASFMREIQDAGGQIHRYQTGMLHAKALLMDQSLAMVGSANFDMRSLFLNYELMQFLYSRQEVDAVEQWIEGLMQQSYVGVPKASVLREIGEGVVRMLAPIL